MRGPVALPSRTTTLYEFVVHIACHRYTFARSRTYTEARRSLVVGSSPSSLSPKMAFQAMPLSGLPPMPRYWAFIEYSLEEARPVVRSMIVKTLGLQHGPPGPRPVT